MDLHNGQGNVGGRRMRLRDALEQGCKLQRLCCGARLAPRTFPLTPFLSLCGRGRGHVGCGSERTLVASHAMVA